MKTRFKSFVIDWTASGMNWIDHHIVYQDDYLEIGFRDHLRWFLQDILSEIFWWGYQGSDEELLSVDHDEIPVEYMTPRQFDYYNRFALTIIPGGAA